MTEFDGEISSRIRQCQSIYFLKVRPSGAVEVFLEAMRRG
jgi:hypothetical protein